eukprot:1376397-Alexandrium_andersonii.AAC.1
MVCRRLHRLVCEEGGELAGEGVAGERGSLHARSDAAAVHVAAGAELSGGVDGAPIARHLRCGLR